MWGGSKIPVRRESGDQREEEITKTEQQLPTIVFGFKQRSVWEMEPVAVVL